MAYTPFFYLSGSAVGADLFLCLAAGDEHVEQGGEAAFPGAVAGVRPQRSIRKLCEVASSEAATLVHLSIKA